MEDHVQGQEVYIHGSPVVRMSYCQFDTGFAEIAIIPTNWEFSFNSRGQTATGACEAILDTVAVPT